MLSTELLTPRVEALVSSWLSYVPSNDPNSISKYVDMVQDHPIVSNATDLRILYALTVLREYTHPDPKIQEEVRQGFVRMEGSFLMAVAEMNSFIPFGFAFSERVDRIEKGKAAIDIIQLLDPRRYDFRGTMGSIVDVVYHSAATGDISIPYESGIHLVNRQYLAIGRNPRGLACCRPALPYAELHRILMAALAIAGQRQATPILVGKTDTSLNTPLLDSLGNPYVDPVTGQGVMINQGVSMLRSLEKIKNSSVIAIDRLDDVVAIAQQADPTFFTSILHYLEGIMLMCFLVPRTILGTAENGTGDSNLNSGHRETLRLVTRSQMSVVAEALIEQVVRPIITFNHGEQDSYGVFPIADEDTTNGLELLKIMGDIVGRTANGLPGFSTSDLSFLNRMRELSSIGQINSEDELEELEAKKNENLDTQQRSFFFKQIPLKQRTAIGNLNGLSQVNDTE